MDKLKKRKLLLYMLCAIVIIVSVIPPRLVLANETKQYGIKSDIEFEMSTSEEENFDCESVENETNTQQETDCAETQEEKLDETIESDSIVEENVQDETNEQSETSQEKSESEIVCETEESKQDNEKETNTLQDEEIEILGAGDITSGSYGNIVWTVDDNGKLTIEGTGEYSDDGEAPWAGDARTGAGGNITSVEVRVTDITSTAGMFSGLYNVTSIDLSGLDTSKVTNMSKMFYHCESLTDIDLSEMDTSQVTDMSSMFDGCLRLTSIDMSKCDTSKVVNMSQMFHYCWHMTNVNFNNCNTGQVTNMSQMFYYCLDLENLDLSMLDTKNVTDMSKMFSKCRKLKQINLDGINTENVITISEMFYDCNSLEEFDLSILSTKNLKDMSYMFWNCSSIKKLDFSSLDLDNVNNKYGMISGCSSLTELDLGNIKRYWGETFAGCSSLTSLDLKNINTKDVVNMELMFYKCSNLETLDISSFDTSNVVNMKDMFYECKKLKSLDLSNFDMSKVITDETKAGDYSVENMLYGCESLETIYTPCNLSENIHITLPAGTNDIWYKEDGTQIIELPQGLDYSIIIKKNEIPVKSNYTLNYLEKTLTVGDKVTLLVVDENGEGYNGNVTWSSSDNKVALISENGEVSGIAEGTAVITARLLDGTELQCAVSVECIEEEIEETLYIEEIPDQTYTGKKILPQLRIRYNKVPLEQGKDYTVSYKNNIKTGSAVVTVKGKGNLSGSLNKTFEIVQKNINDADVIVENTAYNYDNKPHKKAPTITYNGKSLKEGQDFVVEYGKGDFTSEGTYDITVKGIGNFTGTYTNAQIVIVDKSKNISKAKVSKLPTKNYDKGKNITLAENELVVTLNGNILKYNTDYKVSYSNNANVGKATVVIQGIGEYAGTKKANFNIKKQITTLSDNMVKNKTTFATMQIVKGGCTPEPVLEADGETLVKNIDYTVSYKNNKKVGVATVVVKGKGAFKGSIKIPFIITTKSLTSSDLVIRVADKPYVGRAGKYMSKPTITDSDGNMLKADKDFVVESYSVNDELLNKKSNPENGTTITVKIKGKGAYTGSITAAYKLQGSDISKAQIKVQTKDYTGSAVEISDEDITKAVIKSGKISKNLVFGQDYEVAAYYNNIKKGTATVVFRGIGEYSGEKSVKFKIGAWSFWNYKY